eukprot:CAMPEP_0185018314 /NCGR_PEP_ID=MMETSP1103-20130426/1077_1 /TAXON_ID=36769 /ORGANISM="Paraphysomonas bandaiensis, Strain Caron Lab Isolate" /LENGTH=442 /DNA_ID=CAMNT_0027548081 /DNA_START=54 /DNA_END=1382 /DNA_ORIENTATION=+
MADQAKLRKRLEALLKRPENQSCADCGKRGPRWASANLGTFFCIECSGIHRNLGVHISFVRSVNLDSWTVKQVEFMEEWGNARANAYYEAKLPPSVSKPRENDPVRVVERFIRDKYELKRYIADSIPPQINGAAPVQAETSRAARPAAAPVAVKPAPTTTSKPAQVAAPVQVARKEEPNLLDFMDDPMPAQPTTTPVSAVSSDPFATPVQSQPQQQQGHDPFFSPQQQQAPDPFFGGPQQPPQQQAPDPFFGGSQQPPQQQTSDPFFGGSQQPPQQQPKAMASNDAILSLFGNGGGAGGHAGKGMQGGNGGGISSMMPPPPMGGHHGHMGMGGPPPPHMGPGMGMGHHPMGMGGPGNHNQMMGQNMGPHGHMGGPGMGRGGMGPMGGGFNGMPPMQQGGYGGGMHQQRPGFPPQGGMQQQGYSMQQGPQGAPNMMFTNQGFR